MERARTCLQCCGGAIKSLCIDMASYVVNVLVGDMCVMVTVVIVMVQMTHTCSAAKGC